MPASSNPPRVSHDASIYKMFEAEAAQVVGKISLPDQGIEYENTDGKHARIDLELAAENYWPAYEPEAACQLQDPQRECCYPRSPRRVGMSRTDGEVLAL